MNIQSSELVRMLTAIGNIVQQCVDTVPLLVEPVAHGLIVMSERYQIRKVLNAAGWLPHHTTPLSLVADCSHDVCAVRIKLNEYYAQNWSSVRKAIESQIAAYNVDEEAKATFREALDAHGYGLHRSVCRVLFPEIERVLRTELLERMTGHVPYEDFVKKLVDGKTLDDVLPGGWFDFDYFGHLTAAIRQRSDDAFDEGIFGLFQRVGEGDLQRVRQDPVPNRHAAMHGFASYSSPQNSLNAIFVADYMFRLTGSFKNAQTDGE